MKVDAEVTIKFILQDVCNSEDLDDMTSFEDMILDKFEEGDLVDLLVEEGDYEITEIKSIH